MTAWAEHGSELYLKLLHANFLREPETQRADFAARLVDAATGIRELDLAGWMRGGAWRELLTASWIVGLLAERSFYATARARLLVSSTCYAGQGLCFAMARLGGAEAADALCEYLATYLPVGEREYDQEWAIGALAWLDQQTGSTRSRALSEDASLWIVTRAGRPIGSLDPGRGIARMRDVMKFMNELV